MTRRFAPLLALLTILCSCASESDPDDPRSDTLEAASGVQVTPIDTTLFDSLRAIERRSGGTLGFAALHIESGWRTVYNGEKSFPMASVGKLPMAIAFLRAVDDGRLRLDTSVVLTRADHRTRGSRIFFRAMRDSGGVVSLHALLDAMLTHSDNTACDVVLRLAGGPPAADALMAKLGLDGIDITSYEAELILKWAGVDPAASDSAWTLDRIYAHIEKAGKPAWEAAQARLVDDPEDAATPDALARLLAAVAEERVLSPAMTDTLLAIMGRAATGKNRIPGALPPGTPVAHKTGSIGAGSIANDVGIITLPGGKGRLVVVALVKGAKGRRGAPDRAIAAASGLAYNAVMRR